MRRGEDIAVQLPGLFIVHHNKPSGDVEAHAHPEHHLIIPLQGEATIKTAAQVLTCGPGRMLYVAPNVSHSFYSGRDKGERLICMLDGKLWKKVAGPEVDPQILPAQQLIKELLFYLLLNKGSESVVALIAAFTHALCDTIRAGSAAYLAGIEHIESRCQNLNVQKALAYLRQHMSENPGMNDVARVAGLSLRSLNRLFLQELSLTPKQYVTALRIDQAKQLLLSGNYSVTEIAFTVGYNSLSQFITTFREMTGQIPSEYGRKSI